MDLYLIVVVGYLGKTIGNPDVDWMHSSEPQKFMNGTPVFQPRRAQFAQILLQTFDSDILAYIQRKGFGRLIRSKCI